VSKFYAVKKGKLTGIFENWEDCAKQVMGFSGAIFKGFDSYEKAEEYLDGKQIRDIECFYVVTVGKKTGIYTSFEEASQQVKGFSGAKYKKFLKEEVALEYFKEHSLVKVKEDKIKIEVVVNNKSPLEKLLGRPIKLLTERISYQNNDKKWKLFLFEVNKNQTIKISGVFDDDFEFGKEYVLFGENIQYQGKASFQVESYQWLEPKNKNGIVNYLKTLKGLNQKAEIIYEIFKEETIDILKNKPELIVDKVKGIGIKSAIKWQQQLLEQTGKEELMKGLFELGLSEKHVYRLIEELGAKSIRMIKDNPYQISDYIKGYGFKRCDALAFEVGIKFDDIKRIESCLKYLMKDNENDGHCYILKQQLISKVQKQLKVSLDLIEMNQLIKSNSFEIIKYNQRFYIDKYQLLSLYKKKQEYPLIEVEKIMIEEVIQSLIIEHFLIMVDENIYLKSLYDIELMVAKKLTELVKGEETEVRQIKQVETIVNQVCQDFGVELEEQQRLACIQFNLSNAGVHILNGSAGTGKTFTLQMIIEVSKRLYGLENKDILPVAPTGKAAKVMKKSIGMSSKTIHRALGFLDEEAIYNEDNPFPQRFIVCDETSMLDLRLANNFFMAMPCGVKLILMGDSKQLPSIGAGNVLSDLIQSKSINLVTLDVIKRQKLLSGILKNANHVIKSERLENSDDFDIIEVNQEEQVINYVVKAFRSFIKNRTVTIDEIQLLIPQRIGSLGTDVFNYLLQKYLNPLKNNYLKIHKKTLTNSKNQALEQYLYKGDKVMHVKNDYQKLHYEFDGRNYHLLKKKGIFNGEAGIIFDVIKMEQGLRVVVSFDGFYAFYDQNIEDLELAYALTIHKSQGAQWSHVLILVLKNHQYMLSNNLLYTAITRSKDYCAIIGDQLALQRAITVRKDQLRLTSLDQRLKELN
jgi:ATP-dependent exoDNAse (exonuclease V), alpha subunit - helicase superfamily I member